MIRAKMITLMYLVADKVDGVIDICTAFFIIEDSALIELKFTWARIDYIRGYTELEERLELQAAGKVEL